MDTSSSSGSRRGFGALSPERRREISTLGGKAAHAQGKGHKFTREEARAAGRKGGLAAQQNRKKAFSS